MNLEHIKTYAKRLVPLMALTVVLGTTASAQQASARPLSKPTRPSPAKEAEMRRIAEQETVRNRPQTTQTTIQRQGDRRIIRWATAHTEYPVTMSKEALKQHEKHQQEVMNAATQGLVAYTRASFRGRDGFVYTVVQRSQSEERGR